MHSLEARGVQGSASAPKCGCGVREQARATRGLGLILQFSWGIDGLGERERTLGQRGDLLSALGISARDAEDLNEECLWGQR